jgi:hypothetical protein
MYEYVAHMFGIQNFIRDQMKETYKNEEINIKR